MAGDELPTWQKLAFDVIGDEVPRREAYSSETDFRKALLAAVVRAHAGFTLRAIDCVVFEKNAILRDVIAKLALKGDGADLRPMEALPGGVAAVRMMVLTEGARFEQLLRQQMIVDVFEYFEDFLDRVLEICAVASPGGLKGGPNDLQDRLSRLRALLPAGFHLTETEIAELLSLSALRNVITHSGGVADRKYLARLRRWGLPVTVSIGGDVPMASDEVEKARQLVDDAAKRIRAASEAYLLP